MRHAGAILVSLLVLAVAGCPKVGVELPVADAPVLVGGGASTAPVGSTTPVFRPEVPPSPFTLPLESRTLTLKPVALAARGGSEVAIDADEAYLLLSRTGEAPETFSYAFQDATEPAKAGLPRVQSLPVAVGPACGTFETLLPSRGIAALGPSLQAVRQPEPPILGARRNFYVRSVQVQATCVAVGTHAAIWVDARDQWRFRPEVLTALATDFDAKYAEITAQYGTGPSGRADGYNWVDHRVNVLISQQVPPEYGGYVEPLDFFTDDFALREYGMRSNYGKVLYLNSIFGSGHLLNTLIHEYVHIVFYARRLEVYSRLYSKGLPLGQDSAYFGKADLSERWLNEGIAVLAEYLFGKSPDLTYRSHLQRYLDNPSLFDLADFLRRSEGGGANYGGAFLFSAYAHARDPEFTRKIQLAEGLSTAAVDEVFWQDLKKGFGDAYRDFGLSLLLDGYHPEVPEEYGIPFVDLHGGFGGVAMEYAWQGTAPRENGLRFVHVAFPKGKGVLRVKDAGSVKAVLLVVGPEAK